MATSIPIVPTITQVGLNAAKNAQMTGFAINVAQIAFGTGQYVPNGSETSLANEKRRVSISGGGNVGPTTIQVNAEVLANLNDAFWCGEIGFYTDAGVLLALYSRSASPIVYISDTISFTVAYALGLKALPAGSVNVTVDPSGNVALALLGAHETAANPHPQYMQTAANILPNGTTGQILVQQSNTKGDVAFQDLAAGITINVNTKEETQPLTGSQLIIDWVNITTNGIVLHIAGARLDKATDFTINSPTRVTLARTYAAGTKVTGAQNEVAGQIINPLDSTKNLSDLENKATARTNLGVPAAVGGVHSGITQVTGQLQVNAYADKMVPIVASTTTTTIDISTGSAFKSAIQSNTAYVFTGATIGSLIQTFTLLTVNDATAGRSVSFPSVTRWAGGIVPPRTTTANARDVWSFYTDDGGASWGGTLSCADEK